MKNSTTIFAIALAFMLALVSCNQEPQEKQTVDLQTDLEKSIIAKMGAKEGALILEQMNNATTNGTRAPIDYNGELCPGVVYTGTSSDCCSINLGDYWYFSADAGDIVNIKVNRINCDIDPIMILFKGFGDDTTLSLVNFNDDGDPPACTTACDSFGDPILTGMELTAGVYTLGVWHYAVTCAPEPPYTYDVVVTGQTIQSTCDIIVNNIVIDGCETGVANQTLADGTTMQDKIDTCAATATNHGEFVSCVANLTNAWKEAGLITGEEKGAIQSCVAESNIP